MNNPLQFAPQWASAPGSTILEIILDRGWTKDELALRLDRPLEMIDGLVSGRESITIGLAERLQAVLGGSVAFWMTRDLQYRQDLERMAETEGDWVASFPVKEMRQLRWLSPSANSAIGDLLGFFDVASVASWRREYEPVLGYVSLKTSPSFESMPGAVLAWIRRAEQIVNERPWKPWSESALREALQHLRRLSRVGHPERFLPKLTSSLAECGVSVTVLPAPQGCRASGAARWLSQDRALIVLSARHLTDDHLWFTLYHECAHLLLHREASAFVDSETTLGAVGDDDLGDSRLRQELEANSFAEETLITQDVLEALERVNPNHRDILKLAYDSLIAPGILVGQLQRRGRIGPERLNRLKRRYRWSGETLVSRGTT